MSPSWSGLLCDTGTTSMSAREFEDACEMITAGSVRMRVCKYSKGSVPLLLIPDLNYPIEFYQPFAKLATQFTIYMADLAGQGESDPLESYSLDVFVQQFQEVMRHFNLKEPHVLGHGFGASIALLLARQTRIKSISLVAPALFPVQYIQRYDARGFSGWLAKLIPCGRSPAGDALVREYDQRMFDNFPTQFRYLRPYFLQQLSPHFTERNISLRQSLAAQSILEESIQQGYRVRLLLACGDAQYDYSSAGAFLYHKLQLQATAKEDGTHEIIVLQPQYVLEWMLAVQGEA